MPERVRPRIAQLLRDADIAREPEEAIELWAIGGFGAVFVTFAVSPGAVVFAALTAAVAGPLVLWLARDRRDRRFAVELPAALEQVASELRGGGTVSGAVARLAAGDGAVAPDLRRVQTRTQLGLSLTDALGGWPIEHDAPGVRASAGAFAVAASLGGSAADAIDGLATSLRHRLDAAAEARTLSAQARLSAVVVGVAPLGYLAFSSVIDPRSVGILTGTGVGRVCLVIGLALEGLAALWIRHVVRSEA
ncbi:MAG: type II secretion system F family protein [Dehalococcoidia bacterium]